MKKLAFYTMTVCLMFTLCTQDAKAVETKANQAVTAPLPVPTQVQTIKDRIEEIKAMDMSGMTKVQKKEVRSELKAMKQELRATTGVYISIGALIIIILLLILIL